MIKCIIIDDEPLAIDVLKTYIQQSGLLELEACFTSSVQALSFLEKKPIELVFIDIQMPKLNGLELIAGIKNKPKFIITSAFREYALEGFELDVLDFLVKPIAYERFLKSISKLLNKSISPTPYAPNSPRFIFIKENKRMTKVLFDELMYIESQRDYLKVYTETNVYTTRGTITYYEQWLPKMEYIRVHRSFIVSIAKISHFSDEVIELQNGKSIPIGELYAKAFRETMQKLSL